MAPVDVLLVRMVKLPVEALPPPVARNTEPPLLVALEPANRAKEAPAPPVERPLERTSGDPTSVVEDVATREMLPAEPPVALPVVIPTLPLLPALAGPVDNSKLPEAPAADEPVVPNIVPELAEEEPVPRSTTPDAPLAMPENILTAPVEPPPVVPELMSIKPLAPADTAFRERITTAPEDAD